MGTDKRPEIDPAKEKELLDQTKRHWDEKWAREQPQEYPGILPEEKGEEK